MSDAVDPAARRRLYSRVTDLGSRQQTIDDVARATGGNATEWLEHRLADAQTRARTIEVQANAIVKAEGSDSLEGRKARKILERIRPWREQLDQLITDLESIDAEATTRKP